MKIKPDDHWRWYFDENHDRMMLDLANGMLFRSSFPSKMLTTFARQTTPFTVDDASYYSIFDERARRLNLPNEQHAELVLNSLIALRFLKPQMPKSWYFDVYHQLTEPLLGQLIQISCKETKKNGIFIVAEAGSSASLCLLAQPQFDLSDRSLTFCDPIKIMNDRMTRYQPQASHLLYGNVI